MIFVKNNVEGSQTETEVLTEYTTINYSNKEWKQSLLLLLV